MSQRIGYRVDFPSDSFAKVAREAERLGIDLGDLLAIAAAILVGVLVEAKRDVRKAAVRGAKAT